MRSNPALALRLLLAIEQSGGLTDAQWDELFRRRDELSDGEVRALRRALELAGNTRHVRGPDSRYGRIDRSIIP